MKSNTAFVSLLIALLIPVVPAVAVENGKNATGNPYVIPIYNADGQMNCSGALLTPSIVVTATHCVLDKSGLKAENVYVGEPGDTIATASGPGNPVLNIKVSDSYNSNSSHVVDNDIAFLVVQNEIQIDKNNYLHLASESEMLKLKSNGATLQFFGYGATSDESPTTDLPNSFTGNYSTLTNSNYPNSGYMKSTIGNSCKGDSGGPVVSITPSRITLVGILTGSKLSINCSKKENDGSYLTLFTEISKYANLAFDANLEAISNASTSSKDELASSASTIAELEGQVAELQQTVDDLKVSSANLLKCIVSARKVIKLKRGKLPSNC